MGYARGSTSFTTAYFSNPPANPMKYVIAFLSLMVTAPIGAQLWCLSYVWHGRRPPWSLDDFMLKAINIIEYPDGI